MAGMKYIVMLLLFTVMVAVAGTVSRYYVPQKKLARFEKEYGAQAVKRLNSLLTFMEKLVALQEDTKVIKVNTFFNQLAFSPDIQTWQRKDYWASRLEFLGKGQGDCEDFAVAKFLTMMQLGIPEKIIFNLCQSDWLSGGRAPGGDLLPGTGQRAFCPG